MKKTNTIYWIFTILFAGFMLFSSIPDILRVPSAVDMISTQLHYPEYFVLFLGVAKFLGSIAIVIPGFPRIKEWAYAGLMYDLIAATYSQIALGVPASKWCFMAIFFALAIGSYIYYHKKLKAANAN
jgi:uncharacterized membrane protein YphA (DoxX/SURF4 family)